MDTQPISLDVQPIFDLDNFKHLYKTFSSSTPALLPTLYHPTIVFKDPLHELSGLVALTAYFENFCTPDTHYSFEFINQVVSQEQAFFQWQMHYTHASLAKGKPLILNGGTLIKFDAKIIYHEDFYDMGAMIYQHIPILGWAVKKVNARIVGQAE